jgi:capsular polysaccharide transport system ATP-binding protein
MILLRNVSKSYRTKGTRRWVMKNTNIEFPTGRSVALLGRNGAGKSTLLKMIAGTIDHDSGEIIRKGSISWPIGFAGSFHPELTGAQNARFIARVYGVDTNDLVAFTEDFAELGEFFDMPFRTYSSGMRSRLAFGISMGVPFDTYLVDEITSVGDANFREKCDKTLKVKMQKSGAIVVTHAMSVVRSLCDCAAVLEGGEIIFYEDIHQAIHHHNSILLGKNFVA